jgi:hypothetical protein
VTTDIPAILRDQHTVLQARLAEIERERDRKYNARLAILNKAREIELGYIGAYYGWLIAEAEASIRDIEEKLTTHAPHTRRRKKALTV